MKKITLLLVAALLLSATAQAKIFAFGVKAGLEMPSIKTDDLVGSAKASTGFHAGVLAQFNIPIIGIGVQPELLYAYRGSEVTDASGASTSKGVSYLDVPLNITWGIDLKIVRPFVALTPYISYSLTDVETWVHDGDAAAATDVDNFDYGIGLGLGVELFQKVQLMGRYSWGLNNLVSTGSYKVQGFSVSLGYLF